MVGAIAINEALFARTVDLMLDPNPLIRMRASDAVEKASRSSPALLQRHKEALLGPIAREEQQEVKWHLLQVLPRLELTENERNSALALAERALAHDSRIVQAEALSALFALSSEDGELHGRAVAAAEQALGSASPALRARARKLMPKPGGCQVRPR